MHAAQVHNACYCRCLLPFVTKCEWRNARNISHWKLNQWYNVSINTIRSFRCVRVCSPIFRIISIHSCSRIRTLFLVNAVIENELTIYRVHYCILLILKMLHFNSHMMNRISMSRRHWSRPRKTMQKITNRILKPIWQKENQWNCFSWACSARSKGDWRIIIKNARLMQNAIKSNSGTSLHTPILHSSIIYGGN